jgi:hypothetical protein
MRSIPATSSKMLSLLVAWCFIAFRETNTTKIQRHEETPGNRRLYLVFLRDFVARIS